jgi:hypothetical protein
LLISSVRTIADVVTLPQAQPYGAPVVAFVRFMVLEEGSQ